MGINRLLIDSRIYGVWHGRTISRTSLERRRYREEGRDVTGDATARQSRVRRQPAVACAVAYDCCGGQRVGRARLVVTPMTP